MEAARWQQEFDLQIICREEVPACLFLKCQERFPHQAPESRKLEVFV